MALSPEDAEIFETCLGSARTSSLGVSAITDQELLVVIHAARAQGRASLEERVRLLEEALDRIRGETADPPYAWISAIAQAALATPGERENGDA